MKFAWNLVAVACVFLVGCGPKSPSGAATNSSTDTVVMEGMPPEAHGHPEHGPHGGELIELGKEAFHLEMLHDDQTVTLNVLNGAATETVAIEAAELTVSLKHDDIVKTFSLPAAQTTEGKSSSFSVANPEMAAWMEQGAEGAVTLEISGKSYTGKISHDHDHEGHDHDAEGHDHD
ncbi:putative signal peptide protein [Rhodopirellula islandica]|uniref:Signal peptide protein n=1 Tax=Rhodopirellula islandica TaxID=595434 RepID=A0A0J1BG57_RHOIS|nr:hypothetical protein [Rhodopirellula islandica]KLU05525.1 putative signal peptide protein [Rhodopirellula islandica]